MDLRKLEIFLAVAKQQSFSRAGEQLHMAQPAVSIAIKKLEEEFGVTLIERQNRQIRLTKEGRQTQQLAEELLLKAKLLSQSISDMGDLTRGEIAISCPSMVATYLLPSVLTRFLAAYPGLTAEVTQAGTSLIEQQLLREEIELGVITIGEHSDELELTALIDEQVILLVNQKHRWAGQKKLQISQLDSAAMVLYENDYYIRRAFDKLCQKHQVYPDIRMQTNFLPLINEMVKSGLGATIGLSVMAQQEQQLVPIALEPKIGLRMAVAKKKNRVISKANQTLLAWLASHGLTLDK
ncbi:HTH-type transcriptional regulator CynR [Sinobacterium norvegicum]|uniref:HTH-type transcriptional regulator CynR n=1 Tax=Sinobacterium norvegicum TaxID=1641715 RepID=A0ABN8ELQ2_9GAMM|nr:LysR substrate-binding domain-containing protein [Sinobacterium norvegicum]CAH0992337.1 HTH-type transcriptional regulator CynR [Sinobacterium norvegicum]